ncbi:RagB/SusD family nutrient uptake outer membrane protein [Lutibacter sp. HS1-25]|uniref:RagB/SusD family nutrient uptake outer membrane protein n=2 Tax=Lutibacter sp. HS1-25 TaxID=2485000 RepID=UPI001011E6EA|nr:RagB/SusD family nutrient uptake outer membrane protein [Lutibacter sp. HS1-25]RXP46499.1 RagB/SusD family nutrient uptake outer membrane protein [Lutibacter sp. HS1-25]
MKKYLYNIIILTVFLTITTACTDDFVDRDVKYSIDSENYFNSKSEYESALIGAYDLLQTTFQTVLMGEIASDNTLCGGNSPTDVPGYQQVDDMIHTPVNDQIKRVWDWMFAGVQRANYILEFQDKTEFEGKEQIIAEARFLRAYFHFELVKWFGEIPMKGDKRFVPGDETSIPRSPVADVYASIYEDLIYAAANLDPVASQAGRATSGAATALLGKAYLYEASYTNNIEKYKLAAKKLQDVINSGKYQLVMDFEDIWEMDGENGIESIFEIQYTDVQGASYGYMQGVEGNIAVGFAGPNSYEGPFFSAGNNFNLPTQDIVDAFEEDDLRKEVTILDMDAWVAIHPEVTYTKQNEHTGYFNRKYIPRERSENAAPDLKLTNPNNYRAIRYADVLLMAAEAYSKIGEDGKAAQYLNEVRDRAFGDEDHRITFTGDNLYNAILAERRVEFAGEGLRFFDLVRTGRAAQAIDGFTANKNELFPIPLEEIQFSNGNWDQNQGY